MNDEIVDDGRLDEGNQKATTAAQPGAEQPSGPPEVLYEEPVPSPDEICPSIRNLVNLRPYQQEVFDDDTTGILVLHWGRQLGKSYTLAAWAVKRLIDRPGRLVTVLSNSRENGAEFMLKCSEICAHIGRHLPAVLSSPDSGLEDYRQELRMEVEGKQGRIKVLAANPRTARGFSGDLILDEFAFHEDSAAIWEAAEPILSCNPDFLCRIASTGNGRHNMFYRMVTQAAQSIQEERQADKDPGTPVSNPVQLQDGVTQAGPEAGAPVPFDDCESLFKVNRLSRSRAYQLGIPIYHPRTRLPITPQEARERALDKRAYDQNYECIFADENLAMLSHELIAAAERDGVGEICERDWTASALERLRACKGRLCAGFDVGRTTDLSVITVVEKLGSTFFVRAILRMRDMRLPEQEQRLGAICKLRNFYRAAMDMTGLGLGLFEYAQRSFGSSRIRGINFATTVPVPRAVVEEGRACPTVRVTEAMATELLRVYEDRRIQHPRDERLREDLRKPEKVTSPGGKVSIAASRDAAGHADHFWSLALGIEAAGGSRTSNGCGMEVFKMPSTWESSTQHRRFLL